MSSKRKPKNLNPNDDDYYITIGHINTNDSTFLSELVNRFVPRTKEYIKKSFSDHLKNTLKYSKKKIDKFSAYLATSYSIRDRLVQFFNITMNYFISSKAKQLNFVSSEFLMGRFLRNALLNLQLEKSYEEILHQFNINIDDIFEEEYDPGPGSNGSGRFAACLLDSLATLNYPAWCYGLLYSNGYFQQKFDSDSKQIEYPDYYSKYIEPWCIKRPLVCYDIEFGGTFNPDNKWIPQETTQAVANDFLIPGFHTINTIALRLWSSESNAQNSLNSEELSHLTDSVYPSDSNDENDISIRLKQQYFLASATVQDILCRLKNEQHASVCDLPKFVSIHINDTQPCLMTIELLRILIDVEEMSFDDALSLVIQTFSFTCQSLIPMTFERFPVPIFEKILPRHLDLIYKLNFHVVNRGKDDNCKRNMSIIEESTPKKIRMANLAIASSHKVIGVSKTQTKMVKESLFSNFYECYQDRFENITNGVSIRRWLHHCNKPLSELITQSLGGDGFWPTFNTTNESNVFHFYNENKNINEFNNNNNDNNNNNNYSNYNYNNNNNYGNDNDINNNYSNNNNNYSYYKFTNSNSDVETNNGYAIDSSIQMNDWSSTAEVLRNLIIDQTFLKEFSEIKYKNKVRIAKLIKSLCDIELEPDLQLFDVQAKEIKHHHRQTLHIFSIIYRYLELIKKNEDELLNYQPRAFIIAGKASRTSSFLKSLVLLINKVASVVNSNESLHLLLRVVFIPNYNVSIAETLVAGADVNVQISTPGMEAAATSNMKFLINGSLIIGTNDGTNAEIADTIGAQNIYFCGLPFDALDDAREESKNPIIDPKLKSVFDAIRSGLFGPPEAYEEILQSVEREDYFLVNAEFEDYLDVQTKIDMVYQNGIYGDLDENENGVKLSAQRVASIPFMGEFSSDRAAIEYAEKIWKIKQYPLPVHYLSDEDDDDDDYEEEEDNN